MPIYKEKIMYVCTCLSSLKSKIMHFQPPSYDFKFDFLSNFDTPDSQELGMNFLRAETNINKGYP